MIRASLMKESSFQTETVWREVQSDVKKKYAVPITDNEIKTEKLPVIYFHRFIAVQLKQDKENSCSKEAVEKFRSMSPRSRRAFDAKSVPLNWAIKHRGCENAKDNGANSMQGTQTPIDCGTLDRVVDGIAYTQQ